ncbi:hypothetical protein [Pseudoxanthomonas sp. UTMC 1351]|uniref:hypothetical protein n=1 Tax=Pseudoxanthomonas sp. UTMC 1351 TaxID=2695853 RepID=UPI0034CF215F
MKRPALFVFLSALAFAAGAQSVSPAPATPQAEPQQTVADQGTADQSVVGQSTPDQNTDSKPRPLSDHNCLRQTGSRVIRRDAKGKGCANATGRAYTREELERTGGRDLAHSLRLLDPAIQ